MNRSPAPSRFDMWLGAARQAPSTWRLFLPLFCLRAVSAQPGHAAGARCSCPGVKVAVLLFVAAIWRCLDRACARSSSTTSLRAFTLPRLSLYFAFAVLYLACLVWAADILWSVK